MPKLNPSVATSLSAAIRHLFVRATRTWYWLADACREKELPFVLGHALYHKAIHGGKVKNDKLDSEKLALLLRGGNFTTAYADPKKLHATRDLLRRRSYLMRQRAQTPTHIQIINHQLNNEPFIKKLSYKANRDGVAACFEYPSTRKSTRWISTCWDTTTTSSERE